MSNVLMIIVICEFSAVFVLKWIELNLLTEIKKNITSVKELIWDADRVISLIESDRRICDSLEEISKRIDAIYKEIYKNKSGLSDITIKDAAGNEYKFEQSMED